MKRKTGFTLVEMLIVVVIIGILAAALVPKLTGYMERTRDLKRQTDLRNIAFAVEMYRNDYGELPFPYNPDGTPITSPEYHNFLGSATDLSFPLSDYISSIPRDPNRNNYVDIHTDDLWIVGRRLKRGEYLYQIGQKDGIKFGVAALVAKVETADVANYVLIDRLFTTNVIKDGVGWEVYWGNDSLRTIKRIAHLNLCTSVQKGKKGQEKFEVKADGTVECVYSSQDQLYYIEKIE